MMSLDGNPNERRVHVNEQQQHPAFRSCTSTSLECSSLPIQQHRFQTQKQKKMPASSTSTTTTTATTGRAKHFNYWQTLPSKVMILGILVAAICILSNSFELVTARKLISPDIHEYDDNRELRKRAEPNANANPSLSTSNNEARDFKDDEGEEDFPPSFKKSISNIYSKPSGNTLTLFCPAIGRPEPNITWTRRNLPVYRQMGKIARKKWAIQMEEVVPEDTDNYTCTVCNYLGCISHTMSVHISDRVNHKPISIKSPKNLTLPINGSGLMECEYLSDLHSQQTWGFSPCNRTFCAVTNITDNKSKQWKLENVTEKDEGWYYCYGANSLGTTVTRAYLRVVDESELPNSTTVSKIIKSQSVWVTALVIFVILLTFLSSVIILYVLRKLKHEKLLKQRIETVHQWTKKVIIYKPSSDSSGSMETMIMPVVKIEKHRSTVLQSSNADPAPFNEYEFPLDSNWEIPRSQLVLGETLGEGAFGRVVMAQVNNAIVAVKMVKEGHTDDDIASLVREMEVMKIIGKHINIINLLGCCSQNGPLYVIVEFAPFGNLKDFLNKNRPQIIGKDYADTPPPPEHPLTEKHLISFAFQIARGMEYLASRRCIHRDLAARNVLVSEDFVIKIADFGLARDIQDTDYYRKNSNGRLPIKWMAPESLQEKFYDSQSDVWSYGVLLWEIMTFGAQPYPTIMCAEELYSFLMSGQRMEKPAKCSLNIYMLMRQCWLFDSTARPTFSEIVENLDKMLLANEDYLDVAIANLETPPSSSDEEDSDVESLRYHY